MFTLGILIGIYAYLILGLGLLHFLYPQNILIVSFFYFFLLFYFKKTLLMNLFQSFKTLKRIHLQKIIADKLFFLFIILFITQAIINFIGALGPELAFDALWYHLTLPKIYLMNNSINFIEGNLFYYSVMPKLTEMLYTVALSLQGEVMAKIIHFFFGIFTAVAIYKLSRKFFSPKISLLTVLIFYSNLVVAWESITAYVDLSRTFFEVMALWGFINWYEKKEKKWLMESAVMMGLAISTKLLGLGSLFIFLILITINYLNKKISLKNLFISLFAYSFIALLIPLPWFVFSLINTGNPIFPLFSNLYKVNFNILLLNPFYFFKEIWDIFTHSADPFSPVYLIILPLVFIYYQKMSKSLKIIVIYSFLSLIIWYFTPRTGGGRFILVYLPAFSIMIGGVIDLIKNDKFLKTTCIILIMSTSLLSIIYRGAANKKYLAVILNQEKKSEFLSKNLNFSFGDFYDTDNYFKFNINSKDKVLLYGFHNLYYVDFPFTDSSWVKKGDVFNYIAVQNAKLPKRFENWQLIYENKKTYVKVYSLGGKEWVY